MGFIIEDKRIAFEEYKALESFQERYPIVTDIIQFLSKWYNPEIEEYTMTTSGSTGSPKTIRHHKQAMKTSALLTGNYFEFDDGQQILLCLPVKFIAGKMMLVRSIIWNLELVITQPSTYPLANVDSKFDFAAMTPYQFQSSATVDLERCRKVLLGGGPVTKAVISRAITLESEVYHGFGMTETLTHIGLKALDSSRPEPFEVLPTITVQLDERDCLVIQAPHFEKVTTNDIVEMVNKGSFIWKGRLDNVINSGGIKMYPEDIENRIASMIDIPYFISSEQDELLGERLVLCIESKDKSFENLFDSFTSVLAKHEIPKRLYLCSEFSRTDTGKIQRKLTLQHLLRNKSQ